MIKTFSNHGLVWLDAANPTDDEILGLVKRYGLPSQIQGELMRNSLVSKSNQYGECVHISLAIPATSADMADFRRSMLDFLIGKNFLITVRSESIEELDYYARIFETSSLLKKDDGLQNAGYLFSQMLSKIYSGITDDLENISDSVDQFENSIVTGASKLKAGALYKLTRQIIEIKQALRLHFDILESLSEQSSKPFLGPDHPNNIRYIQDQFVTIQEHSTNLRERIISAADAYNSHIAEQRNTALNRVLLFLSLSLPPLLVAAIFTIPASALALMDKPFGWYIIIILMIASSSLAAVLLRRKGWI